jgi:hypothetical protein
MRRLRQLRARFLDRSRADHGECDQPQFPRAIRAGEVWLAGPPTVAASAIAGELLSFEELRRRHEL